MVLASMCLTACLLAPAQSPATVVVAPNPVTWLIIVDDLHLDFRNTGRLRDLLRRIVKELIVEGDRVAIASAGPSALAIDPTEDRQQLEAAIKKATGNALKFEDVVASPHGPVEARYRASTALATAVSVVNNVSHLAVGPTAVLFISNGYDFELLPERVDLPPSSDKRFNVTRMAFTDLDAPPRDPAWASHQAEMRSVLQSIANSTGGFAIVQGDVTTQLSRIADTTRK
jgi:hypothetical protein